MRQDADTVLEDIHAFSGWKAAFTRATLKSFTSAGSFL